MRMKLCCIQSSQLLRRSFLGLPDLLKTASCTSRAQPFSTTPPCASRIGRAQISLPPDVTLRIIEPPVRPQQLLTRVEVPRVVEVEGPLGLQPRSFLHLITAPLTLQSGKISVKLPSYMNLSQDETTRKATLTISDRKERKQREMWGPSSDPYNLPAG